MATENIEKAVAEYFAALRAMDAERWANTFAENAVSHDPVGAPPINGRAELRQFLQNIFMAFEKVGLTEDHVFINGNEAAVKWTGRGVSKNGREVMFEGIDVIEVNDKGLIQTVRAYWNPAALMAQLQ